MLPFSNYNIISESLASLEGQFIFCQASEMELLDENHHWLLIGEDLHKASTLLTPLGLRLDSNVLFASPGNSSTGIDIML